MANYTRYYESLIIEYAWICRPFWYSTAVGIILNSEQDKKDGCNVGIVVLISRLSLPLWSSKVINFSITLGSKIAWLLATTTWWNASAWVNDPVVLTLCDYRMQTSLAPVFGGQNLLKKRCHLRFDIRHTQCQVRNHVPRGHQHDSKGKLAKLSWVHSRRRGRSFVLPPVWRL